MRALLETTPPTLSTRADAREAVIWLRDLTKWIGPGFHPDTPASEYVDAATDRALLAPRDASRLDRDIARAFHLLEEHGRTPYDVAIKVQRRLLAPRLT